ncbi:MAG: hypothetical protein ACP5N2_05705 [Candidatus Nanoarchaeia archaeon]
MKRFEKEYDLFSKKYFVKLKKRTGKSSEWHISLNPETLKELLELIEDAQE